MNTRLVNPQILEVECNSAYAVPFYLKFLPFNDIVLDQINRGLIWLILFSLTILTLFLAFITFNDGLEIYKFHLVQFLVLFILMFIDFYREKFVFNKSAGIIKSKKIYFKFYHRHKLHRINPVNEVFVDSYMTDGKHAARFWRVSLKTVAGGCSSATLLVTHNYLLSRRFSELLARFYDVPLTEDYIGSITTRNPEHLDLCLKEKLSGGLDHPSESGISPSGMFIRREPGLRRITIKPTLMQRLKFIGFYILIVLLLFLVSALGNGFSVDSLIYCALTVFIALIPAAALTGYGLYLISNTIIDLNPEYLSYFRKYFGVSLFKHKIALIEIEDLFPEPQELLLISDLRLNSIFLPFGHSSALKNQIIEYLMIYDNELAAEQFWTL